MKYPILAYASIIILTITLLTAFSFSGVSISLWHNALKRPAIKEYLAYQPAEKKTYSVKLIAKTDKPKVRTIDTTPQRILMVGESMIEGLMFPFMKYAKYNGHNLKAKIWYGSRLLDWGACDTLKKMIADYKPTFIMVSIGANELFIKNIEERESYVQNIVKQLDGQKFIWIGPPIPKKDYGINDMICRNTGADRYFVSKYMTFQRCADGVHPTRPASRVWADSISTWIMDKSRYPIRLKKPEEQTTQIPQSQKPVTENKNNKATRKRKA